MLTKRSRQGTLAESLWMYLCKLIHEISIGCWNIMYVFEGRIENILPMVSVYAGWNPPRDMNLSVFHFRKFDFII